MTNQVDRIDGLVGSIAVKAPVKVATTEAITLSGAQTIDSVALTADESPRQRVLVKDQASAIENGIYDVNSGAWTRSPDFDGARDAADGTKVLVNEGSGSNSYYLSATDPVSIGTDELTFNLFPVTYTPVRQLLTGDVTFLTNSDHRIVLIYDPNGADRNVTPSGSFSDGFQAVVVNNGPTGSGTYNVLTFDPSGLAEIVGPGDTQIFTYLVTEGVWV